MLVYVCIWFFHGSWKARQWLKKPAHFFMCWFGILPFLFDFPYLLLSFDFLLFTFTLHSCPLGFLVCSLHFFHCVFISYNFMSSSLFVLLFPCIFSVFLSSCNHCLPLCPSALHSPCFLNFIVYLLSFWRHFLSCCFAFVMAYSNPFNIRSLGSPALPACGDDDKYLLK